MKLILYPSKAQDYTPVEEHGGLVYTLRTKKSEPKSFNTNNYLSMLEVSTPCHVTTNATFEKLLRTQYSPKYLIVLKKSGQTYG